MRTEIVYEDEAILVVYKPAGLAVQTADVGRQDVVSELKNDICRKEACGAKDYVSRDKAGKLKYDVCRKEAEERRGRQAMPYLGVIHRLDQPVEGLLVFARNPKAAAGLSAQLQDRDAGFGKHYYAVLYGCPAAGSGRLEDDICKRGSRAEIVESRPGKTGAVARAASGRNGIADNAGGRPAKSKEQPMPGKGNQGGTDARRAMLEYRILQILDPPGIALADIRLETGRFHQIRAQMAHGGMPLLGDLKYGSEASMEAGRRLNVRNAALCAYRLEFVHTITGKKMDFQVKPRGAVFSLFSQF